MMIGTQQLHKLLHDISDVIRQELSNKEKHNITTSESGKSVFQHKESLKLGYGDEDWQILCRNH
jgi:hypothetical protein